MPNYDYRCLNCRRRFEVYLSYSDYGKHPVSCPHCKSQQVQRRIGRIRFARSEESRLDDLADPSDFAGLEDDPKAMARMMRKMKSEFGGEMEDDIGPEFDEVVDRLDSGQSPEDIEKSMPDLGAGMGGGMGDLDDY